MSPSLLLCGRRGELETISERWRRATNIDAPEPQLVVIKAERGVGKTRLAIEFYRWLSEQVDGWLTKGYWPDAATVVGRNLEINPDPRDCEYSVPIPYLWWGVRAADPSSENGVGGDAISTYDRFLAPHLVSLLVRARMKDRAWAVAKAWGEVGLDVAANVLQYDTVLSIGKGILNTGHILFGSSATQPRHQAEAHSVSRAMAVIAELEKAFNPTALTFARIPGVIFIDDAQFAHRDSTLPWFIEKLMYTAMTQRWPVLILITHWKAQLSPELTEASNSFAGLLLHARTGATAALGPAAQLPGGYLGDNNMVEIDLGPVPDLLPVLTKALPGLTIEQSAAILDHLGGNPRFLEQVIAFLLENEWCFERKDPSAPLTSEGLQETLDETKSQDIFKIVYRRLRDAPEEVQEAVCLASLQGVHFVNDLVEAIAQAQTGRSARNGLGKAEDPYCVVLGAKSWPTQPVGHFAERLFHHVATELRHSLRSLPDEPSLALSFKATVVELIGDAEYARTASADGLALLYAIGANLFEGSSDASERAVAQRALANLGGVEVLRHSLESAAAAWERLLAIQPTHDRPGGDQIREYMSRIDTWQVLAEVYQRLHWPAKMARAYRATFWEASRFLPEGFDLFAHSTDLNACRERFEHWRRSHANVPLELCQLCTSHIAQSLLSLSEISRALPSLDVAKGDDPFDEWTLNFRLGLETSEPVIGSRGPVPDHMLLAWVLRYRAYALNGVLGDGATERQHFRLLEGLARVAVAGGEFAAADSYLNRALEVLNGTGDMPADAHPQADSLLEIATLSNLGMVAGRSGETDKSEGYLQRAVALADEILQEDGVKAHIIVAKEDSDAGEQIREVIIPKRFVNEAQPSDTDSVFKKWRTFMSAAADAHGNLAACHLTRKDLAAAKVGFLRSVQIREEIGTSEHDLPKTAIDFQNLARVAHLQGDRASTCDYLRRSFRVYRFLEQVCSDRPIDARAWSDSADQMMNELRVAGCEPEVFGAGSDPQGASGPGSNVSNLP